MNATDTGPPRTQRFAHLYQQTYTALLRFVERRVHPSHAEDIVADVFLVAWRRLDDIPPAPDEARAWLYGVANRTLRNGQRADQRRHALTIRIADHQLTGAAAHELDPDLVARRLDLVQAWRTISPRHQEALALAVWDGLTAPQAARVLGISPVAFRLRLTRARRALRHHADTARGNSHDTSWDAPPDTAYGLTRDTTHTTRDAAHAAHVTGRDAARDAMPALGTTLTPFDDHLDARLDAASQPVAPATVDSRSTR
ncbi:RNA polymerase sigma factor [Nonomuraea soli]|uniref:RNA polymerase sigma-70 factor (ECF subfamily) n=1 Tax=Nonomuraea soli TaxID=1032476 RepID=A0A7W0HQ06_9ACTN|nr:sigma-70 family RNA polymerase sigma factor [Nonomuraea soli]MBA2891146.1 RNA polymerase sigma-70 factor (ECF subfamily) [Nonomuraea soli]